MIYLTTQYNSLVCSFLRSTFLWKVPIRNFKNRKNVSWQLHSFFFFFKLASRWIGDKNHSDIVYKQSFNEDALEVLLKCDSTFAEKNLKISLYSFIFYLIEIYRILIHVYYLWPRSITCLHCRLKCPFIMWCDEAESSKVCLTWRYL